MAKRTYMITGMTCGHCVSSVSGELGKIAGVSSVDVVLATGQVDVTGDGYTDDQIREAVHEAGYVLSHA